MAARQTKNESMDHEWEFDTHKEMMAAAKKEGRVCGDRLNGSEDGQSVEIWNWHQDGVRWKGSVKAAK